MKASVEQCIVGSGQMTGCARSLTRVSYYILLHYMYYITLLLPKHLHKCVYYMNMVHTYIHITQTLKIKSTAVLIASPVLICCVCDMYLCVCQKQSLLRALSFRKQNKRYNINSASASAASSIQIKS